MTFRLAVVEGATPSTCPMVSGPFYKPKEGVGCRHLDDHAVAEGGLGRIGRAGGRDIHDEAPRNLHAVEPERAADGLVARLCVPLEVVADEIHARLRELDGVGFGEGDPGPNGR
jgi:hypothetical protein